MTLKRLITTWVIVLFALVAVTGFYMVITNITLRPMANQLVLDQLGNSNASMTNMQFYFTGANALLVLSCIIIVIPGVKAGIRYFKSVNQKENIQ